MGKLIWRIILVILPVMVIVGLARIAFNPSVGNTQFVPTWNEFLDMMAKAPSVEKFIYPAVVILLTLELYNSTAG